MRSSKPRASLGLKLAAVGALLFLHLPMAVIVLYAFTTDESTFRFPLPGLTTRWFAVAWGRSDVWDALFLSVRVALVATLIAIVLGSLAAAAVSRSRFFGRDSLSFLLVLPLALPGIVTAIALRSALGLMHIPFSFWTIIIGHATFCMVIVFNNVLARFRRMGPSQMEASMDLGANSFQTFRHIVLPHLATALS
ncbi:MAG: polyamine/opine/phosphonate uptake transporter family, permease protein [Anaerolineales bacterium]|nr:polyamine/opine/phosphonate uptake transporter family, permease protein [Anaerolineales bacterium]